MKRYVKCKLCKISFYIIKNGKYSGLFNKYAKKQTLFINSVDCPECKPPNREEIIFNDEYNRLMKHKFDEESARDKANIKLQNYKLHISYYSELKKIENAWHAIPQSVKEKPVVKKSAIKKKPYVDRCNEQYVDHYNDDEYNIEQYDDDEYCNNCCTCEIGEDWSMVEECRCKCRC